MPPRHGRSRQPRGAARAARREPARTVACATRVGESGPRKTVERLVRIRAATVARGLFDGTQFPPYLPTYDGIHPTHGGDAALGALWLDGLRRLP